MTQRPPRLALRFTPASWTPTASGDFQQLQALLKAAQLIKDLPALHLLLGDPTVVIPAEIWQRVEVSVVDDGPKTILEHLLARLPGIAVQVEDPIDTIDAMGRTARFQDAAIASLQSRVDARGDTIAELEAEVARLTGELAVEEGKVANLSAELARRLQQDAEDVPEFEPDDGSALARLEADVAAIAADAALAVLDAWIPKPTGSVHKIRVMIHGDTLRVLLEAEVAEAAEEVADTIEAEVGDKIGDRLGLDSSVVVQVEPGQPAPDFLVRGGEAASAEAPGLRWYWRHQSDPVADEQGPLASETAAVDATWEEAALDAKSYQGEDER
jgi:hypothetical protein